MQRKHAVSRRSIYHKVVFFKSLWTISIVWLQNEHLHFTDNRPASAMFIHKRKNNNNVMNKVYHQKCIIENWRHFKEAGSDGWRETAAIKLDSWKIHMQSTVAYDQNKIDVLMADIHTYSQAYGIEVIDKSKSNAIVRWQSIFLFETKGPADWANMQ